MCNDEGGGLTTTLGGGGGPGAYLGAPGGAVTQLIKASINKDGNRKLFNDVMIDSLTYY